MFLPSPNASSDAFWSGLDHGIQSLIKKTPVLRSRNRIDLRLVGDVVILAKNARDAGGNPLFDDPTKDLYLSPSYSQKAKDILKGYGLRLLDIETFLNLLGTDLRSPNSRLHGKNTTDDWHSAVARLLSKTLKNSPSIQQRLRSLPLLPLRSGTWTSATSGPVYFPTTGGNNIPNSLDLKVIAVDASNNSDRSILFQHLGVCQATNDDVRVSIFRSFNSESLPFDDMKEYLSFLYLTHQIMEHAQKEYAKVQVVTGGWIRKKPHQVDIYLPGTHDAYSPASLLAVEGASPGLSVDFLHSKHMESTPDKPGLLHPSWESWLCDSVRIRKRLRLVSQNERALSDTFLYVHEHRPEKFLGLFEHLWLHEKSSLVKNRTLRSKIEDLSAKNLCGVSFSLKLKETWLPLKALRELVGRYMEYPGQFPFLKFEESDTTEQAGPKWNFLSDFFSVSKDDSVEFLLEILHYIQLSCPEPSSDGQARKVFDLYVAIYAKLTVTSDGSDARRKITLVPKRIYASVEL